MNKHVPKKFEGFENQGLSYDFVAVDELATIPQSAFEAVTTMQMDLTSEQLELAKSVPGVEIKIVRHCAKQSNNYLATRTCLEVTKQ